MKKQKNLFELNERYREVSNKIYILALKKGGNRWSPDIMTLADFIRKHNRGSVDILTPRRFSEYLGCSVESKDNLIENIYSLPYVESGYEKFEDELESIILSHIKSKKFTEKYHRAKSLGRRGEIINWSHLLSTCNFEFVLTKDLGCILGVDDYEEYLEYGRFGYFVGSINDGRLSIYDAIDRDLRCRALIYEILDYIHYYRLTDRYR